MYEFVIALGVAVAAIAAFFVYFVGGAWLDNKFTRRSCKRYCQKDSGCTPARCRRASDTYSWL